MQGRDGKSIVPSNLLNELRKTFGIKEVEKENETS